MRHGQGCYMCTSGMKYEGMWINDLPEVMACKLFIEAPQELNRGQSFSVAVGCYNEDGFLVEGLFVIMIDLCIIYIFQIFFSEISML
jgi:hypothetical protein